MKEEMSANLPPETRKALKEMHERQLEPLFTLLSQGADEYIDRYDTGLSFFLGCYKDATEVDFIEQELGKIEGAVKEYEPYKYRIHPVDVITPWEFKSDEEEAAYRVIKQVGYGNFYYSSKRKIEFLQHRMALIGPAPGGDQAPTGSAPPPPKPRGPETLKDIFVKPEYYGSCLNVLRMIDPPAISDENRYIGKNKGVFTIWIRVLEGEYIHRQSHREYARLLNAEIKGLKLTDNGSELSKYYDKVETDGTEANIKSCLNLIPI